MLQHKDAVLFSEINSFFASSEKAMETIFSFIRSLTFRYYIGRIKNDENWLAAVQKKAEEKNIPLDSMIYLDAVYMVENE